jgi:hypothetical protein
MYPVIDRLLKEALILQETIGADLSVLYGTLLPGSPPKMVAEGWLGSLKDRTAELKIRRDDFPVNEAEKLVRDLRDALIEVRSVALINGVTLSYSTESEGRIDAKAAQKETKKPGAGRRRVS